MNLVIIDISFNNHDHPQTFILPQIQRKKQRSSFTANTANTANTADTADTADATDTADTADTDSDDAEEEFQVEHIVDAREEAKATQFRVMWIPRTHVGARRARARHGRAGQIPEALQVPQAAAGRAQAAQAPLHSGTQLVPI